MRFRTLLALTTVFSGVIAGTAVASDATPPAAPPAPELTRADLESWLDGFLPYTMATGDIAGGVIAVVKDGEILLQKGYGYADVEAKKPVDAERTLFRAGSVGKLITHTAAMQLIEKGKLDLDADIAKYLDFPIPAAFGKPVTLHNLMTHTGGFEERVRAMMASDPAMFMSLDEYVKTTKPTRIFPPGEVPSYCNYCVTLEGYIVQRVSGEPYDDYLDRHIFQPLGMQRSTFRQPLPADLAADMSKGYTAATEPAKYFELIAPAPAGSIATTGADMARFMIAHLQALKGDTSTVLGPEAAQRMHTTMFRATPPSLGMAVGFFERDRNGHRIREHGGDTQFFHSSLFIFMDDGVGVFASFNSSGKDGAVYKLRDAVYEQFTDRYFPAPLPNEPATATAVEHARIVAGRYAASRRAETTFFKLLTLLLGQTAITANDDGTLEIPVLTALNNKPKRWREVQPFVWREVDGKELMAAQMQNGRVRMIGVDSVGGIMTFMPVPGWLSSGWILPAAAIAIGVMLLTVIAWPIAVVRRRRVQAATALPAREATVYQGVRVAALLYLIFAIGWFLIVQAGNDLAAYDGRMDGWFVVMQTIGLLGVVGVAVAIWHAWLTFARKPGWKSVAWSTALAASAVFITWFGIVFNLIRFTVQY